MTSSHGEGASRGGGRRAGLFATVCLVALAPVKFSLPVVLYHLDAWPRGIEEWGFMSWPSSVFFGLLALCLVLTAREIGSGGMPLRPLAPAVGFLLAQGLSAGFTIDRSLSGAVMALFASLVAGYALGCALGRDDRGLRWLLGGWLVGACLVAWSGIGQATGGLEETRKFLEAHPEMGAGMPELWERVSRGRVFATFVYPNALGGYVATTIFLVAAWILMGRGEGNFHLRLALGTTLGIALFFCLWKSQSKGGYAALVATALVLALAGGFGKGWRSGLRWGFSFSVRSVSRRVTGSEESRRGSGPSRLGWITGAPRGGSDWTTRCWEVGRALFQNSTPATRRGMRRIRDSFTTTISRCGATAGSWASRPSRCCCRGPCSPCGDACGLSPFESAGPGHSCGPGSWPSRSIRSWILISTWWGTRGRPSCCSGRSPGPRLP